MIYIGTTHLDYSAIYFDVHSMERHRRNLRICGTIGDGHYEGEVLVELGQTDAVTFADAWLGGRGFREFTERCDLDRLREKLLASVRDLADTAPKNVSTHPAPGRRRISRPALRQCFKKVVA